MGRSGFALAVVPFRVFDGNVGDDIGCLLHAQAIVDAYVAHAGAAQSREVGAGAQRLPDVAREGADVCSFAAHHAHADACRVEVEQFYLVDYEGARFQFYGLSGSLLYARRPSTLQAE